MSNVFKSVAAKCDARDGLKDGLIDDPRLCRFDPANDMPRCAAGSEGAECLTNRQVDALQQIYSGPKNGRGEQLFVGQLPGSEDESTVAPFLVLPDNSPNLLTVFAQSWMKYLAFGDPNYDPKSFDFDRDPSRIGRVDEIFNPTTDLSLFKERGGKMVTFWGWADNALNPQMGLNYYDRLRAKYGASETESFYRFFLVPGVAHCRGGYGPSEIDALTPVINWVEKGMPPERLPARLTKDGNVKYNRAYCAYPQTTQYNGSGSTEDPSNFSCSRP
jgi:feruloyl esterase